MQVKLNRSFGVAGVTDGNALADIKIKIAAARCEDECAVNGRCPVDFFIYKAFNMLQDRIAMITGLGEGGIDAVVRILPCTRNEFKLSTPN